MPDKDALIEMIALAWPEDDMKGRLHSLLNPDRMHPIGCSSWVDEAVAFLHILASEDDEP